MKTFCYCSDSEAYKNVCKNVSAIEEKYCDLKNLESPTDAPWHQADGCYVRGGKTIYLKPHSEIDSIMVSKRAYLIKKFANDSKEFWDKTSN